MLQIEPPLARALSEARRALKSVVEAVVAPGMKCPCQKLSNAVGSGMRGACRGMFVQRDSARGQNRCELAALTAKRRAVGEREMSEERPAEGHIVRNEAARGTNCRRWVARVEDPEERHGAFVDRRSIHVSATDDHRLPEVAEGGDQIGQPACFGDEIGVDEDDDVAGGKAEAVVLLLVIIESLRSGGDRQWPWPPAPFVRRSHCVADGALAWLGRIETDDDLGPGAGGCSQLPQWPIDRGEAADSAPASGGQDRFPLHDDRDRWLHACLLPRNLCIAAPPRAASCSSTSPRWRPTMARQ